MASYLVTGASRGIGLGLCAALAAQPPSEVPIIIATYRKETDSLKSLLSSHPGRVHAVRLDVGSDYDVQQAVAQVDDMLGAKGLDVLVNNAGVLTATMEGVKAIILKRVTLEADAVAPQRDDLEQTLRTNVFGVQLVTRSFLPLLEKGTLKKVINISSTMGSIELVAQGKGKTIFPAYNISKAALNMLTVHYACDFADKGFTFAALSPGWIKTDLGSSAADLELDEAIPAVLRAIQGATREQNGKFLDIEVPGWKQYTGAQSPW